MDYHCYCQFCASVYFFCAKSCLRSMKSFGSLLLWSPSPSSLFLQHPVTTRPDPAKHFFFLYFVFAGFFKTQRQDHGNCYYPLVVVRDVFREPTSPTPVFLTIGFVERTIGEDGICLFGVVWSFDSAILCCTCFCVQYLPPVHSTDVAYVPYFFFSSVKTDITHLAIQFLFVLLWSVLLCTVCRLSGKHFNISTYWQNLDNRNCQYFAPPFLIDTSWCLYRRYGIPINWGQPNSSYNCNNWTHLNRSIRRSLSKDPPKTLAKRNWL